MNAYIITAFGMLPIVLVTSVISLMVDNFNQTIGISVSVLIVSLMIDSINSKASIPLVSAIIIQSGLCLKDVFTNYYCYTKFLLYHSYC